MIMRSSIAWTMRSCCRVPGVTLLSNYVVTLRQKHAQLNGDSSKTEIEAAVPGRFWTIFLFILFFLYVHSWEWEQLLKCFICAFVHSSVTATSLDLCFLVFEFPRNPNTHSSHCLQFCSWKHWTLAMWLFRPSIFFPILFILSLFYLN